MGSTVWITGRHFMSLKTGAFSSFLVFFVISFLVSTTTSTVDYPCANSDTGANGEILDDISGMCYSLITVPSAEPTMAEPYCRGDFFTTGKNYGAFLCYPQSEEDEIFLLANVLSNVSSFCGLRGHNVTGNPSHYTSGHPWVDIVGDANSQMEGYPSSHDPNKLYWTIQDSTNKVLWKSISSVVRRTLVCCQSKLPICDNKRADDPFVCNERGYCLEEEKCSCLIDPIFGGDYCQWNLSQTCSPECTNGICNSSQLCECSSGWKGPACNTHSCDTKNECNSANGAGSCTGPNICSCNIGWDRISPSDCAQFDCDQRNNCTYPNGVCEGSNSCRCVVGSGLDCVDQSGDTTLGDGDTLVDSNDDSFAGENVSVLEKYGTFIYIGIAVGVTIGMIIISAAIFLSVFAIFRCGVESEKSRTVKVSEIGSELRKIDNNKKPKANGDKQMPEQPAVSEIKKIKTRERSDSIKFITGKEGDLMEWEIDPKSVEFGISENPDDDILGIGSYGAVRAARVRLGASSVEVAVKRISLDDQRSRRKDVENEVKLMTQMKHRNIVSCFGMYITREWNEMKRSKGEFANIIMELCRCDLQYWLECQPEDLSWEKRTEMILQIAEGMKYIHSMEIVHRDLKIENILVFTDEKTMKISDFGSSKRAGSVGGTLVGTPRYLAPEQFFGNESVRPHLADIFSFGILMWEILTGKVALLKEMRKFQGGPLRFITYMHQNNLRPDMEDENLKKCPIELIELMTHCWEAKAKDRPQEFKGIVSKIKEVILADDSEDSDFE